MALRVTRMALGDDRVAATVAGARRTPSALVKAVTYHRLQMAPSDGGWHARVVFDV